MQRAALVTLSLARLAIVTVTGAIVAVVVAVAASPLMPIGPARLAEPNPGVEVNLAILGAGSAAIALLPLAVLLPPAWRAARQAHGPLGVAEPAARQARPSRLAAALTHAGSVTGGAGVAMAFEPGHGRTAVPVRSALAGSVIAVAALAAAAVFGASLIGLVSTPHDYGQNWVQEVDLNFGSTPLAAIAQVVKTIPAVTGYAAGNYGQLTIDGQIVPAIGLDQVRGSGYLTLLAGRAPAAQDEIALGAQTLRAIGARLGQTIHVTVNQDLTGGPGPAHLMRIVGVAVLPAFSRGSFTPTGLGTGAVLPAAVLSSGVLAQSVTANLGARPARPATTSSCSGTSPAPTSPPTPPRSPRPCRRAAARSAPASSRPSPTSGPATSRTTPLSGTPRSRSPSCSPCSPSAPWPTCCSPACAAAAATSPLLKTLGFTRRQVLAAVAWEASAFAAVALLARAAARRRRRPLGLGLLRDAAGVSAAATVPLATVLLAIPATLLAANLIAAAPGWEAARLRPALVLRTE